ncbi:MAG: MauE/DoxX family redox-associated membrane protein [Solirubrobacteraceae bacterium]
MTAFLLGVRWLVAVILLIAGVTKIGDVQPVAEAIARYGVVPRRLIRPVAMLLPAVEVALAGALAIGFVPSVAGGLAGVLFGGFALAIAWNLLRGRRFDCGCGTGGESMISWWLVLRDTALAALGVLILVGPSGGLAVWPALTLHSAHGPVGSTLVPVPLIVILLACACRLTSPLIREWRTLGDTRTSRGQSPTPKLSGSA